MANHIPARTELDRVDVPEAVKAHAEKCCNDLIATMAVARGLEQILSKLEGELRGNRDAVQMNGDALQLARMIRERLQSTNLDLQVMF